MSDDAFNDVLLCRNVVGVVFCVAFLTVQAYVLFRGVSLLLRCVLRLLFVLRWILGCLVDLLLGFSNLYDASRGERYSVD